MSGEQVHAHGIASYRYLTTRSVIVKPKSGPPNGSVFTCEEMDKEMRISKMKKTSCA